MILEAKQTTVAYRCPHCGSGVISAVGLFNLHADMVKLKCSCGQSEMKIVCTKDGQIRFTVPCMLCPNPHNFTVSSNLFFNKELFVLPCPYSDINICMMGEINHVKAELSRTELELLDLLEKSGIDSFELLQGDGERYLSDPQVTEIVTYVIKELDEEGKIHCRCPEGQEGNYEVEIRRDGVMVTCLACGASKLIPADSLIHAHDFLNADSLDLI
ncbi:MAG: hypothetical protein IKC69_02225 [Clostridia bacterium]|nr:hypothetical protein [Clostridia bacterium]